MGRYIDYDNEPDDADELRAEDKARRFFLERESK